MDKTKINWMFIRIYTRDNWHGLQSTQWIRIQISRGNDLIMEQVASDLNLV